MNTFIGVIYFKNIGLNQNIAIAFHYCPNETEEYRLDTARFAYKCLATNGRIDNQTEVIVIGYNGKSLTTLLINVDQELLAENIELFEKHCRHPFKMDMFEVCRQNDGEIEKYAHYIDRQSTEKVCLGFQLILLLMWTKQNMIYELTSDIWDKLSHEKEAN